MSLKFTVGGSQNEAWYALPSTADGRVTALKSRGADEGVGVGVGVGDVGDSAPRHAIARTIVAEQSNATQRLFLMGHSPRRLIKGLWFATMHMPSHSPPPGVRNTSESVSLLGKPCWGIPRRRV